MGDVDEFTPEDKITCVIFWLIGYALMFLVSL